MAKRKVIERETRVPLTDVQWIRCRVCGTHVPASRVLDWCKKHGLTNGETEIVIELASGTPRRRLAHALYITENTLKTRLRLLLRKVDVPNVPALLRQLDLRPDFDRENDAQAAE